MEVTALQKIVIVGCGPGASEYMTEAGRNAIGSADLLVGFPHLLAAFGRDDQERISAGADMEAVLTAIEKNRPLRKVAVLVSGDPGLCSLAAPVLRRFGKAACHVIPGVSSVQLAFARLGLSWENARILSAHREIPDLSPEELAAFPVIAVLAGHARSREWIAGLGEGLAESHVLVTCEDLSLASEAVRFPSLSEFRVQALSTRAIILLIKEDVLS